MPRCLVLEVEIFAIRPAPRSPIPDPYSSQPAFERAIQTVEDAAKFSSCSENHRHGVIGHEPQPPTQLDLGFDFGRAANAMRIERRYDFVPN